MMGMLSGAKTYWKFAGQCTECGHCQKACPSLSSAGLTLGKIAKGMLACERRATDIDDLQMQVLMNGQLTQAVRGCFLCTTCQQTCFANNDVSELIYAAREDFQNLGLIPREAWSSVLVDQEWDIFTAYRAIHGIGYPDLVRHVDSEYGPARTDCEVAFFPGCSLAAYGPELTREIFATVEELGGTTTMIDHCCGSPLKSAGFYDRATALCNLIGSEIAASGAKQVVCACPGCRNAMEATLERLGIACKAVTLAQFLVEHGFTPKRDFGDLQICISKSCQDRDGRYLEETRALLDAQDARVVYGGCCGAGGAVSAFDFDQHAEQTGRKLSGVADGETIVTMCPTCTYTYALYLMSHPRDIACKNYLELVFENQFDWDLVYAQLNNMWSGPYGAWLAQVFA